MIQVQQQRVDMQRNTFIYSIDQTGEHRQHVGRKDKEREDCFNYLHYINVYVCAPTHKNN